MKASKWQSITKFLFVTSQIAALFWVTLSYAIAIYSTVKLGNPYPVEDLSQQAIITILGVNALKVLENIFEHNDSKIFGQSTSQKVDSHENDEI